MIKLTSIALLIAIVFSVAVPVLAQDVTVTEEPSGSLDEPVVACQEGLDWWDEWLQTMAHKNSPTVEDEWLMLIDLMNASNPPDCTTYVASSYISAWQTAIVLSTTSDLEVLIDLLLDLGWDNGRAEGYMAALGVTEFPDNYFRSEEE